LDFDAKSCKMKISKIKDLAASCPNVRGAGCFNTARSIAEQPAASLRRGVSKRL
jgi:hypothetical protein